LKDVSKIKEVDKEDIVQRTIDAECSNIEFEASFNILLGFLKNKIGMVKQKKFFDKGLQDLRILDAERDGAKLYDILTEFLQLSVK
jgi:hypothetical protein